MKLKVTFKKLKVLAMIFLTYRIDAAVIRFLEYIALIRAGTYCVNLYNGLRFNCRAGTSDFQVADEIFVKKIYSKALNTLPENTVVIDIGANIGMFSIDAAARGARIISYEPMVENLKLLKENVELNALEGKITIANEAVADKSGTLELFVKPGDTGGATGYVQIHPEYSDAGKLKSEIRNISVPCITLADAIERAGGKCDLLKMDCEGAEYDIFKSIGTDVLEKINNIIFEYHPYPSGNLDDIEQKLRENAFKVERFAETSLIYAEKNNDN